MISSVEQAESYHFNWLEFFKFKISFVLSLFISYDLKFVDFFVIADVLLLHSP